MASLTPTVIATNPIMSTENLTIFQLANKAADYINALVPKELQSPKVGIICGSGLGGLVNTLEATPQVSISYSDIPGFPQGAGLLTSQLR